MVAGYRIGRDAPDLRIGADKVAAIYLGSQRLYPSSLTWSTDPLQRGTFTTTRYPANFKVGLAALVFDTLYFTATRRDAVLRARRFVTATQQTYTMTFPVVPFRRALRMSCNHTLIQLYGQDAIVALGNIVGAEQGIFALTGRAVDMAPDRYLEMASRTFSLTGPATNVRATRRLTMAQASFGLTGQNMITSKGVLFPCAGVSFTLTGQAMTPKAGRRLNAAPQTSFTLTGQAMTPRAARKLAMAMGSRPLTGQAANVRANRKIVLNPIYGGYDGFSLLGQAATLTYVSNPTIAGTATTTIQGTTVALNLPSSAVAGDHLYLFVTGASTGGARSFTTPSGWTEVYNIIGGGALRRGACYYKVAAGGESSVSLVISGLTNVAAVAVRVTSAAAWEAATPTTGTSNPDPPSLSPVGGNGKLWFGVDHGVGGTAGAPTYPSGMSGVATAYFATGTVKCAVASINTNASSYNPGAFTDATSQSIAGTVSIR